MSSRGTGPAGAVAPDKLTISLWDFSWYAKAGPGEPFEDLDQAFAEAVERGYNTVRICAMSFLLFRSGLDSSALRLGPLQAGVGCRVRWYDVREPFAIDARAHLLALFRAAKRHDCYVIVSSWEYQQSPVFAADRRWLDALLAVPPERRAAVLAEAHADLIDLLASEGLDDRVVLTEIHNEVNQGHLTEGIDGDVTVGLRPRLEVAVETFKKRHPDRPCAVSYARVPLGRMRGIPTTIDTLVVHPYVYGVLQEFRQRFVGPGDQPSAAAAEILRPGAPDFAAWQGSLQGWQREATAISDATLYLHDWCDPDAVDGWLERHYPPHRIAMAQKLTLWLDAAADWAEEHGTNIVLGEGWIGYTPLLSGFEGGDIGAEFCRLAIAEAVRIGAWGTVVCSNAAPHHPMWQDIALQRDCNDVFRHSEAVRAPTPRGPARTLEG